MTGKHEGPPLRAALVHDWLTGYRGGEKVLEVFCELLPEADIYTLIHLPGTVIPAIEEHAITASWLNRLPGVGRYYRYLLPVMPAVARRMRVRGYDLVVAVSHCVAHGVDTAGCGRFITYCLTPMRYAWGATGAYFGRKHRLDARYWVLRLLRGYLRRWDRRAAARVGEIVADCRCIHERVRRHYGRESAIIYPPVDTEFYHPLNLPREDFYLWVGALAPYKRIDLVLDAFRGGERRVVVIGEGQDLKAARRAAPPNVSFLGRQPDAVLREHYARCRALLFPGEEDFGIVPLEAQACGCPVIAYGTGGALETVVDLASSQGKPTGVYFHEATAASLAGAVQRFEYHEGTFDPAALRTHALGFSRERCTAALKAYLFGSDER